MRQIDIGSTGTASLTTTPSHTAESIGNPGAQVISTATLIVLFEEAAHNCVVEYFDDGEISVGTSVNVKHVAAAIPGTRVIARAAVTKQVNGKIEFDVEVASENGKLLMAGTHRRFVVSQSSFLASLGDG